MKNKLVLLLSLIALAAPALATTNDPSITTGWPQYGDSDRQIQARLAYSWASYIDNLWATNANVYANTMDITNATTLRGAVTQAGPLYNTPASLTLVNSTGNTNVAANAKRVYKTTGPTAHFTISGIAAGTNGQMVTIYNLSAYNMTFANADSTYESNAVNRITTLTGSDVSTTGAGAGSLIYDGGTSNWVLLTITQ